MIQVSTSATLALKIFFPTLWITYFGVLTFALLVSGAMSDGYGLSAINLSIIFLLVGGVAALYFTVMQLKRVEMDADFVFITNYFKNFRYPYHNIEKMEERDYGIFRIVRLYFKTPGSFGKYIVFIPSGRLYNQFLENHPEVKALVVK